jgi:hypothetical protein
LSIAFFSVGCHQKMPEVRGQVLDAQTGKPIEGAIVKRVLYRPGPLNIVDTTSPDPIKESRVEVTTDAEGQFSFPPFSARKLTGMGWLVFKPGMMTASGCWGEEGWEGGGCSGFGSFMPRDPWHSFSFAKEGKARVFEIGLRPPTTDDIAWPWGHEWTEWNPATGQHDLVKHFPQDVDPWGEYFRRLNILTLEGWLAGETVIIEASAFAENGQRATLRVISEIAEAGSRFAGSQEGVPCYKADVAWRSLILRETLCDANPDLHCDPQSIAIEKTFLQENCPTWAR